MPNRIRELRKAHGLTQAQLGKRIGCSGQYVRQFESGERPVRAKWALKLAREFTKNGELVDPREFLDERYDEEAITLPADGRQPGLRENEMTQFAGEDEHQRAAARIAEALYPHHANASVWEIRGRALDLAGYLPGDLVIVDLDRTNAAPGDVVCAQVYDWSAETANTVMRIYEPPYLITASCDPGYRKPELVDGERVVIKGLIVASFRPPG